MSKASKVSGYTGWLLPEDERKRLLAQFPTSYDRVIAHHCTLKFGTSSANPGLPDQTQGTVVGVTDYDGVQALVLEIDGTTKRWDGKIYHITWSLDQGRKPYDSNTVLQTYGWSPVVPVKINLVPKFFPIGA